MIAYHQQNGNLMADWSAAWRTWCLNQVRFRERDTKARQGGNRFTNGRPRPASPREAMEIILGRSFSPEPPPHDGPTIDMNPEEYAYHG